jgi:hypothetical protein
MDNTINKIYSFRLEPEWMDPKIASFMKHKTTYVEYDAVWEKIDDSFYLNKVTLNRVWRNLHKDDETNLIQNSWNSNELPLELYEYFNLVISIHSKSLIEP